MIRRFIPSSLGAAVAVYDYAVPNRLPPRGLEPTRLLCPWDFPGKNTGVDCHFLLHFFKWCLL